MSAQNTDKFTKGARKLAGQLDSSGIADTTIDHFGLVSASGLPTDTAIPITVDRVDSGGVLTPEKEEVIKCVISGDGVIDAIRGVGGTAQAHGAGAIWEIRLTASQWEDIIDGILVEHNQDGTHKDNGWQKAISEWSYSDWDETVRTALIATESDETGHIQLGDRITFEQLTGGQKYGIVTAITVSDITLFMHEEDTLDDEDILSPKSSHLKNPFGFNSNPINWTIKYIRSTSDAQTSPTVNIWYQRGGTITIPIGIWDVDYSISTFIERTSIGSARMELTLSTSPSTETNVEYTSRHGFADQSSGVNRNSAMCVKSFPIAITDSDIYYVLLRTTDSGVSQMYARGSDVTTVIRARCAYL